MASGRSGDSFGIVIKWSGKEYTIDNLQPNHTILQLKEFIKDKTGVLPARQKLLGLKFKGKLKFCQEILSF